MGETGTSAVVLAVANAVHTATRRCVRKMPIGAAA
jgi:CO/xanthine dehydrogenase Mo-binding subunit